MLFPTAYVLQLYTTPFTLRLICICRHLPCYIPAWVFLTIFPLPHTLFSPELVRKLPVWVFSRFFALKNTPRGFFHAFLLSKTHDGGYSGIFASLSADRFSFTPFALSSVSISAIRTNFPFIT